MNRCYKISPLFKVLLIFILLVCISSSSLHADEPLKEKKLTLMIYMCGSNLESEGGAATADLTEILRSRYNADAVNVIAMLGGTRKWWGGMDAQQTAVYEISGNRPAKVWSDGLLNMGDSATLSELLDYGYKNYPADNYALVLWDHGGGPMSGVCWDDLSQSDNLTMQELQSALDDSPFAQDPLEWIGFDACLMASVETAHLMEPYARYMIASQETEPGSGWNYSFLSGIENDADGGVTGGRIIEAYMENTPAQEGLTLSCTDLSKIADVETAMDAFFSDLAVNLTEDTFSALSNMRQSTHGFGRSENAASDHDLVDLTDLVSHYAEQSPDHAEALLSAIQDAVVSADSTDPASNGLSVYHPYYNKNLYQNMGEQEYSSFFFAPGYTQYMQHFSSIWLGESMSDWSKLAPAEETFTEGNQAEFTFQLSEEQQANFASAQLLVLSEHKDPDSEMGNSYAHAYITPEVTKDDNGVLSAVYTGRTLYCVDENGDPLTGCLSYSVDDDSIVIPVNFVNDENGSCYYTLLYCVESDDVGGLEVRTTYVYDEASQQYTNRLTIDQSDYNKITFPHPHFYPTYDEDTLLAFDQWRQNKDLLSWYELYKYSGEWHFQFFDEMLSGDQLYVTFQVTDTQANTYSTELTQVINPDLTEIAVEPSEITSDLCHIQCSVFLNASRLEPGLVLSFYSENPTDRELAYSIKEFTINRARSVEYGYYSHLKAGESEHDTVPISGDELANLDRITSIEGILEIRDYESYETLEEIPVSFKLDADISSFSPGTDTENVLAQTETDGLEFQLLSIAEDNYGTLTMDLHIANHLDDTAEFDISTVAVNGYGINTYESFSLGGQEDIYTTLKFDNDVYHYGYYDHSGGSEHLVRHSYLSWYGVDQITEVSLISDDLRVDLELEEPVSYEQKQTDDPIDPVLLYENGDVQVFLEQVWVIDQEAVLAVEVRNQGAVDRKLELDYAVCDGDEDHWFIYQSLYAWAGITSRAYIELMFSDGTESWGSETETEAKPDFVPKTLSVMEFTIKDSSSDGMDLYDAAIRFNEPVPYNVDGGILLNSSDLDVSAKDRYAGGDSGPVLSSEVILPEDVHCLNKDVSLKLTEEQQEGLTFARALLVAVCNEGSTSSESPSDEPILMTIERTDLDISSGDTAAGRLQGIYLAVQGSGNDDTFFQTQTEPKEDGFSFKNILDASVFSDLYPWLFLTFDGWVDTQDHTAALSEFHLTDTYPIDDAPSDYTKEPVSRFTSCEVMMVVSKTKDNGDGSFSYVDGGNGTLYSDYDLGESLQLEVRSAETLLDSDMVESIGVVYQLFYDESLPVLTDIYPWE